MEERRQPLAQKVEVVHPEPCVVELRVGQVSLQLRAPRAAPLLERGLHAGAPPAAVGAPEKMPSQPVGAQLLREREVAPRLGRRPGLQHHVLQLHGVEP